MTGEKEDKKEKEKEEKNFLHTGRRADGRTDQSKDVQEVLAELKRINLGRSDIS